MDEARLILVAGALLGVGLVASLLAARVRVPGLVLFLGVGMAIGSDGTGWIHFDDYELARAIGVVALALILFEGGLTAGLPEIRPVLGPSLALAVLGTALTAVLAGLAAAWLFDLSILEGLLVGSIVASTDGAAIFSLLRGSTLRRRLARTLEGEAGFNDPIAVLLVIGFIDWIERPGYGIADMLALLAQELAIGAAVGVVVGALSVQAFRRARLASAGLYPVASLATAAIAFGAAESLQGSGFLSVYIAGLALGGATIPAKGTVTTFHQGLAWVAQIAMFLALGLLVFPAELDEVALEGTLLALVVVFVARPAAAFAATVSTRFSPRERLVLGWAGLRGAVPVVLATFPVIEGVPGSQEFFNIVFFAVLISTLVQGATFEPLARRLRVTTSQPALPRPLAETGTIRRLGAEIVEFPVSEGDALVGARVRDLGLPRDALVNVIVRHEEAIPPRGSTSIQAGDRLHVLIRQDSTTDVNDLLERWRAGPIGRPLRPRRTPRGHAPIFSSGRWDRGEPVDVEEINGVEVVERLRTRRDVPGALFLLADGRYAVTGPTFGVGGRELLSQHARRRLALATDDSERAWWEEVIGTLAV
jgi:cell volume regulation protein A